MNNITATNPSAELLRPLVGLTLVLTLLTVVLSAYIRLSVNGIGCEPWPACYGFIGHTAQQQGIDVLTGAGKTMQHSGIRKLHRVVASLLGITVLMIVILAYRQRHTRQATGLSTPLFLLGLTLFLSILGYSTPSPDLPVVTVSNLLGGIIMLALLWWLWCRIHPQPQGYTRSEMTRLRPLALAAMLVLLLQISLGGWSSGYLSAAACSELFSCTPSIDWSISNILVSYSPFTRLAVDNQGMVIADNATRIVHVVHRLMAIISFAVIVWLVFKLRSQTGRIRTLAKIIFILLFLQIFIGVTGIITTLPLLLVTAHNTLAALLLMALTDLNFQLKPRAE